jgi:sterol desaturase/sphingolipid hydroxylase (fatty acid hydroxylase superfamily)
MPAWQRPRGPAGTNAQDLSKAKFTSASTSSGPAHDLTEADLDLGAGVLALFNKLGAVLLSVGSIFSLTSLFCALCVASAALVIRRRRRNRRLRLRTLVRALFPRRIMTSPSLVMDVSYFLLAVFVFGVIFGWALISYQMIGNGVAAFLTSHLGTVAPTSMPDIAVRAIITLALFLAYELGYWFDHYLMHRVPMLWEFHKVHHSATVLTPLTIFRVHPVDSAIFANIMAVSTGITGGVMNYAFGITAYQYAITDTNIILVVFVHAYIHLQHSHVWISFPGVLGRILLSPAHHQIHHSDNPIHFDKNLGSGLAIWDFLFGTLYVPRCEPEKLNFGVKPSHRDVHTLPYSLFEPVRRASARANAHVRALLQRPPRRTPAPAEARAAD